MQRSPAGFEFTRHYHYVETFQTNETDKSSDVLLWRILSVALSLNTDWFQLFWIDW